MMPILLTQLLSENTKTNEDFIMKSNHRILNYVDLLLAITAIIILTVFIAIFFKGHTQVDFTAKETITLTLRIKEIPIRHSGLIKNGENIYLTSSEKSFGIVKYISYDNETVEFIDKQTNASTIYKAPDKMTALLLVEATAEQVDGEYYISDTVVKKSDHIDLHSPSFAFTATVVNIENNKE